MIEWIVKRTLVGNLNKLLERHKDGICSAKETLKVWISRLDMILFAFRSLLEKLDDGKIDSEEIVQTVNDVKAIIKAW